MKAFASLEGEENISLNYPPRLYMGGWISENIFLPVY